MIETIKNILWEILTCETSSKEACMNCLPPNCYCEFTCMSGFLITGLVGVAVMCLIIFAASLREKRVYKE